MLEEARKKVEAAGLDSATRDQLLRRVDRAIAETKQFIEQNRPQIELAEKNNRTRQDVERRAAGEGRSRREARPDDRRVQQAHGRAALRGGRGGGQAGRRTGPREPGRGAAPLAGEVRPPLHERQGHREPEGRRVRRRAGRSGRGRRFRLPTTRTRWSSPTPRSGTSSRKSRAEVPGRPQAAALGARDRDREEAPHAGLAAIHQRPAEQGAGLPGQAGRGQLAPRSAGPGRGRRDQRHAGHDRAAQRDHAQERA